MSARMSRCRCRSRGMRAYKSEDRIEGTHLEAQGVGDVCAPAGGTGPWHTAIGTSPCLASPTDHHSVRSPTPFTVKNVRISTDILWRVFRLLTFVSVDRRNNEARAHIAMWFRIRILIVAYAKLARKISVDMRLFFTALLLKLISTCLPLRSLVAL